MDNKTALVLKEISDKLGVAGTHLWLVLLKQSRIEMFQEITLATIVIAILTGLSAWCWKQDKKEPEPFSLYRLAIVISLVLITLTFICTAFSLQTLITNPEFWALKQLVGGKD